MWIKKDLSNLIKEKLKDCLFVVVSNREPYIHRFEENKIKCILPASGMALALDPVMRASAGLWIAHGSGDADKKVVDKNHHIKVPPDFPKYDLRRVWLSKAEEDGYYYGFSNQGLWPLCHVAYTRPVFLKDDWETYKNVNKKFANVVLEEVGSRRSFVFIQDYQLALLSRMIRGQNPNCVLAQFWHIPWPSPEVFRICPWREEILEGLLGNDLLGFHIRYHCQNFLDSVSTFLEAKVDYERFEVVRRGKPTLVRPYPISIDFEEMNLMAQEKSNKVLAARFLGKFGVKNQLIGLGIDRIDYTKGLPERLRAIDIFLEKYPFYLEKFSFIQVGVLSRIHIKRYKEINDELNTLVEEVNFKYQTDSWKPIHFVRTDYTKKDLIALFSLADFCIVSSLHDGMNLVAKEFVASKVKEDGVLILSRFTGAARELVDALLINPYDTDTFAKAIKRAIEMPLSEKRKSMKKMREVVQQNNIYRWAGKILSELLKFEFKE